VHPGVGHLLQGLLSSFGAHGRIVGDRCGDYRGRVTSRRGFVAGKQEVRDRVLVGRRARSAQSRSAAGEAMTRLLLQTPEVGAAGVVAAYVSTGSEPPTDRLLDELDARGVVVLLPVLLPDLDLAWARYQGAERLEPGPRGIRQPAGAGVDDAAVAAITSADVVLCPGLAVDATGVRLGRGGGSYDRALARLRDDVWSCVLLYDDEVVDHPLPADAHDQRVRAAATPSGIVRFARGPAATPRR
jgi:5-formyltetrahydrofolate cyclo-ligase